VLVVGQRRVHDRVDGASRAPRGKRDEGDVAHRRQACPEVGTEGRHKRYETLMCSQASDSSDSGIKPRIPLDSHPLKPGSNQSISDNRTALPIRRSRSA